MKIASKMRATSSSVSKLEDLPNIGSALAEDLRFIGIEKPKDLVGADPYDLYNVLQTKSGVRHDPCVLDTFIAACRFMAGEPAKPWWAYTKERKLRLKGTDRDR